MRRDRESVCVYRAKRKGKGTLGKKGRRTVIFDQRGVPGQGCGRKDGVLAEALLEVDGAREGRVYTHVCGRPLWRLSAVVRRD